MRVIFLIISFFFITYFSGCAQVLSPLAGEWGQLSKDRNNVAAIKPGTRVPDVTTKIGKPQRMEEGEDIYAGWQQWFYPTGSLLVYRGEVKSVQVTPMTETVAADLKKANKKGIELAFEEDKKENQKTEAEQREEHEKMMWGRDGKPKTAKKDGGFGEMEGLSYGK